MQNRGGLLPCAIYPEKINEAAERRAEYLMSLRSQCQAGDARPASITVRGYSARVTIHRPDTAERGAAMIDLARYNAQVGCRDSVGSSREYWIQRFTLACLPSVASRSDLAKRRDHLGSE
jgi:hypothetical protein